jgi:hypothetical protein
MGFFLFLLVNAVLFIRPAEIVPALVGWPIYEAVIIADLLVSLPALLRQLTPRSLAERPLTACVLGMLAAVVLSHLSHLFLWGARHSGIEFTKVLLYYLLLVANVNTLGRLRGFLAALVFYILVLTSLALLQYHGAIHIQALETLQQHEVNEETGELVYFLRLRGTGTYNDPNDLSLVLVTGLVICLYGLGNGRPFLMRLLSLLTMVPLAYGLALTKSRGGFMALVAALLILIYVRFGWKKTLALAVIALLALFVLFEGRQTQLSTQESTAQERIQKWSEGLVLFREAPLFGIGEGEFVERVGLVAHNSFIHCYSELGVFGGTLFLGMFFCALWSLHQFGKGHARGLDPRLQRLRPYLMAIITGYGIGLLSLSRSFVAPTYLVLGLSTLYLGLAPRLPRPVAPRLNWRFLRGLALLSPTFLIGAYAFVNLFVQRP